MLHRVGEELHFLAVDFGGRRCPVAVPLHGPLKEALPGRKGRVARVRLHPGGVVQVVRPEAFASRPIEYGSLVPLCCESREAAMQSKRDAIESWRARDTAMSGGEIGDRVACTDSGIKCGGGMVGLRRLQRGEGRLRKLTDLHEELTGPLASLDRAHVAPKFAPCRGAAARARPPSDGFTDADAKAPKFQGEEDPAWSENGPFSGAYLWSLALRHKRHTLIGLLSVLVCASCNLAAPVLTGVLFESLASAAPMHSYWRVWAALAVVYTVEPLLTQVYIRSIGLVAELTLAQMRMDLFRALLGNRVEFFDRFATGELLTLVSTQLGVVRDVVVGNTSRDRGLRAVLEAVGSVAILVWLSARMGPPMAAVIVLSGVVAARHSRRLKALFASDARQVSQMVSVAGEALGAIKTVRTCAGEGLEQARFGAYVEASFDTGLRALGAKATQEVLIRGSIHLSLLLLFAVGGYLVSRGLMPVRALLSGIGFTFSLCFATQGVANTLGDLRKASGAIERIQEVLANASPETDVVRGMRGAHRWSDPRLAAHLRPEGSVEEGAESESSGASPRPRSESSATSLLADRAEVMAAAMASGAAEQYNAEARRRAAQARRAAQEGDIVLRGVSFRYPARPEVSVIRDLDLTIERGCVTALVGRSGSGKSTIASLIAQLYRPDAGEVLVGDVPVSAFSKPAWAQAVAFVTQEPALFTGTIADNISYGAMGECSQEAVERAARTANAHEFIARMPAGFDTVVGPQGTLLSGGQRQRIAVARALVKDAPVLILDEATSALDAVSERFVHEAMERLERGRTVLVIAHRLSTVQSADKIVVLKEGRVIEQGTHKELLALQGEYADLVGSQRLAFV